MCTKSYCHVVVHIPILSPFFFRQSLYSLFLNQIFLFTCFLSVLLPEAICCCLQRCNIVASEVMVGGTCISILIVMSTTINQLETNVLLITFIA